MARAKKISTRICANPACGVDISHKRMGTRYCCGKCYFVQYNKPRVHLVSVIRAIARSNRCCAYIHCGASFTSKTTKQLYCSKTCCRKSFRLKNPEYDRLKVKEWAKNNPEKIKQKNTAQSEKNAYAIAYARSHGISVTWKTHTICRQYARSHGLPV